MDALLNKNIFKDKELLKLSPDFSPNDLVLRMQMRSTMVKDTHLHPKFKSDVQRKMLKRPKEWSKIGKEIAKIRNGFQAINLKNQIMLKNAVKYVDGFKSEHFVNGFNDELDIVLGSKEESYMKDISEMNLALQNNAEFKINEKPNIKQKINTKVKKYKIKNNVNESMNDSNEINEEVFIEDTLRVECTIKPPSPHLDHIEKETMGDIIDVIDENAIKASDNPPNFLLPRNGIDKQVDDLQTLLIMLAISPQKTKNEEELSDGSVSCRSLINDEIKESPNITDKTEKQSMENNEVYNFLNVKPIRIEINERIKVLMKKYTEKWKNYVSKKKQLETQRKEEAFNAFFEKLSKRKMSAKDSAEPPTNKAKLLARDYSRYRHRYQMQKHIIALQKAKLEEQSRIINELKYNRIIEASKISVETMKDEVRKTYNEIDKHLKPKLKTLTAELKVEIEEPDLVLHCLKVPQFLQRMEKRAREREEKHAKIRERRKQMEEERLRMKQQEELAKMQMDKDEKIKRMNELKEKRKREKIENIRKKQYEERMRALNVMAELHYEKTLKAKYGIRPFRILMEIKKDNIEKSKAHYKFQLKKNVFLNWMWYTEDMWYERNFKAEDFYRKKMLRRIFDAFKQNHHNFVVKKQVAEDYYDLFITSLVFKKFRAAIEIVKKENVIKLEMAAKYHNSILLFRAFCCWRSLPALNALKREQEARKARWRQKVLQVVPDYTPPED